MRFGCSQKNVYYAALTVRWNLCQSDKRGTLNVPSLQKTGKTNETAKKIHFCY
ncbi:MAG: hypothetical protein LBQ50_02430 [Planctomycetaceae bacterium]|nr:hypothetical protein [Planctomycetaceae bacterium]